MNEMLPAGWTAAPLGDLARVYSGGTPSRGVPTYWGGGIPWVTTAEIDTGFISSIRESITEAGLRASAARIAPPGTLLLAMYGQGKTRGKVALLCIPAAMNQACAAIEVGDQVDRRYLFFYLASRYEEIRSMSNAGSQENLSGELVRRIPIVLPPLDEQREIAALLGDADDLTVGLERMIAKKQAIKQSAMQQLLSGKIRLAGYTSTWESRRVSEMGDVLAGKALNVRGAGAVRPYLRTKNVLDGQIDLTDILWMPMTDAEFERFRIEPGDVLLNEGQSLELVGRCSIYSGEFGAPCAMQNQLLRFRAHAETSPEFAAHLFRYCQQSEVFSTIATKTTSVAHLGNSRFANLRLHWPTDRFEQVAIAEVLSDMDAEMVTYQSRLDKARMLKQGMAQNLLTGRTRLTVSEGAA